MTTSFNDWVTLRQLVPDNSNGQFTYSLNVRCPDVSGHVDFGHKALYSKFNSYFVSKESTRDFNKTKVLSFPTFFQAYRAWVETNKSTLAGHRITVEPSGGCLDSTKVHMILVSRLPKQLSMTTFVTRFVRYLGLLFVDARPREDCAIVGYSMQSSVDKACSEVVKVKVDGKEFTVVVEPLDKRPPKSVPSVLKAIEANKLKKVLVETEVANLISKGALANKRKDQHSTDRIPTDHGSSKFSNNNASCPEAFSSSFCNVPNKQDNRNHDRRSRHRFDINARQFCEMFKACDSEPPKWMDVCSIKFIIVNQQDPIRFWAWLWDNDGQNARDLAELEKYIRHTAPSSPAPATIPGQGERGVALGLSNDNSPSWFRCFVLSADSELEILSVFFCDYGISTNIPNKCFRYTAKVVWSLPPQGIPLKLFGYSLTDSYDRNNVKTIGLLRGNVLRADVKLVNQGSHIVQINNITLDHSGSRIDEDIVGSCGKHIKRNARYKSSYTKDVPQEGSNNGLESVKDFQTLPKSHSVEIPSLFDYEPEKLRLALLTEVRDLNLIYLKTKFEADLQLRLEKCQFHQVCSTSLIEGDVAMLVNEGVKHRVVVLQVSTALNKLKVLHVDYGNVEWVLAEDLYELPRDLKDYPYQATAASLAGLVCNKEKVEEAIVFLKAREKSMVRVKFVSRVGGVELFDPDTNRSLNLEMVQRGLASVDKQCPVKQDLGTLVSPNLDTSSHIESKLCDRVQDLNISSLTSERDERTDGIVQAGMEIANSFDMTDYRKRFQHQEESPTIHRYQPPQKHEHEQLKQQQNQQQLPQHIRSTNQRQRKQPNKQQPGCTSQQNGKEESHSKLGANKQPRKVYRRQDDLAVNVMNVAPPPDIVISTKVTNGQGVDNFEYHRQLVRGRERSLSATLSK